MVMPAPLYLKNDSHWSKVKTESILNHFSALDLKGPSSQQLLSRAQTHCMDLKRVSGITQTWRARSYGWWGQDILLKVISSQQNPTIPNASCFLPKSTRSDNGRQPFPHWGEYSPCLSGCHSLTFGFPLGQCLHCTCIHIRSTSTHRHTEIQYN